ncbi:MAG: hypothetical protein GX432_10195 [Candidatus Atribacteria bacterium]|nr:hypothetical protein [Candidatus Atribacteria bacterium]
MDSSKNVKKYIFFTLIIFLVSLFLLPSCSQHSISPTPYGENTVLMKNNAFSPKTIVVSPGTEITWVNLDPIAHSVTCLMTSGMSGVFFDSGSIEPGFTYKKTFNTIGQFNYYCKYHSLIDEMTGTIIVQ